MSARNSGKQSAHRCLVRQQYNHSWIPMELEWEGTVKRAPGAVTGYIEQNERV